MDFSRREYWSGLPFPSPGDLPNSGVDSVSHVSCIAGAFLIAEPSGKPHLNALSDPSFLPFLDSFFHICLQDSYWEGPLGASSELSVSLWVFLGLRWAGGEIFLQPCRGELPIPLVASGLCPKERPRESGRTPVGAEDAFVPGALCEPSC